MPQGPPCISPLARNPRLRGLPASTPPTPSSQSTLVHTGAHRGAVALLWGWGLEPGLPSWDPAVDPTSLYTRSSVRGARVLRSHPTPRPRNGCSSTGEPQGHNATRPQGHKVFSECGCPSGDALQGRAVGGPASLGCGTRLTDQHPEAWGGGGSLGLNMGQNDEEPHSPALSAPAQVPGRSLEDVTTAAPANHLRDSGRPLGLRWDSGAILMPKLTVPGPILSRPGPRLGGVGGSHGRAAGSKDLPEPSSRLQNGSVHRKQSAFGWIWVLDPLLWGLVEQKSRDPFTPCTPKTPPHPLRHPSLL